jgi:hypothetical protein
MGNESMRRLTMAFAIAVAACGWLVGPGLRPVEAVGLCNCCLDPLPAACSASCAARQNTPGQCPAFVIYDGDGATGATGNPLNAMSLKELDVGSPRRLELEQLRRFLEKYRRQAVQDWRKALNAYTRGKLGKDAFETASTLYRDALVGYYHGIRAYRENIGGAPE